MKKSIKRGLAALLAALLIMPTNVLSASAEESPLEEASVETVNQAAAEVTYNPGAGYFTVYDWNVVAGNDALLEEIGLDSGNEEDIAFFREEFCFDENGKYTIQVEPDAFFPYEVEFTVNDEKTTRWFETPDSTVEVGGHVFGIDSYMTGEQVTGMTLNVAGKQVVIYSEKEFVDEPLSMVSTMSMLPLEEKRLARIDLSGYTPIEMTQVSVSTLIGSQTMSSERIAWSYTATSDNDTYEINGTGDKIDLSWGTYSGNSITLQLIDNNGDQLDSSAIRYILPIKITDSSDWLKPSVYKKAVDGTIIDLSTYNTNYRDDFYYKWNGTDRNLRVYLDSDAVNRSEQFYVKLKVNDTIFPNVNYAMLKAFEGEDVRGAEITDRLITAGTEGYVVSLNQSNNIILEAYDAAGQVVGTLPMDLRVSTNTVTGLVPNTLYDASGTHCVSSYSTTTNSNTNIKTVTMKLDSGKALDATYYWKPYYKKDDVQNNSYVTAAYAGTFASIAEANAAGVTDIKDTLFDGQGYGANYSGDGVAFTIFAGADGTEGQKVYRYIIKAVENSGTSSQNSGTTFSIYGFLDENGSSVHTTNMGNYSSSSDDSYGDSSYFTYYADKEVDLTKLKMDFYLSTGAKLYAGSTEVMSKETILDFSNGPIQFTTASEDGKNSKNYWIAVYTPIEGAGQLYINSLKDESAKTEVQDGVIYSTREVMLDSIHNNIHDIMVANLGTQSIANLKVELSADATVALDDYWQLGGQNSLEGFSDSYGYLKNEAGSFSTNTAAYGKLWNLAKVRLVKKEGVEDGTDVAGTLTFKSGDTTLMVLTLTGTVGDPTIITKEIPAAVKYVPFGVMIQNSNKYSWNTVTYDLYRGSLPAGMTLKENGEVYGVPTETGEYTFTVRMTNSSTRFQNRYVYKEFTLIVVDNTDANVDGATDEGYAVLDRVPNLNWDAEGNYSIRSQGAYASFQDIYLDGVKLIEGTDYTKSEGSTRITISSQTLKASNVAGAHTLGMEFREGATSVTEGSLKRAAQNYYLGEENEYNNNSASNDNGSNVDGNNDDSGEDDNGSNAPTGETQSNVTASDVMVLQYTVVKGDTLSKIAARNHMTLTELLNLNPQIKNPNLIYIGQVINLGNGTVTRVTAAVSSQEFVGYYTIVKGDCLFKIAGKYNISLANLLSMNPQIAGQKYIFPGQQIRVK